MTAADANTPIVTATGVVKTFGGLRAVDVDKLEIRRNKITALIGPNGAGKTTFFNLLTGFDEVDSGTITLDGEDITGTPPHRLAAKGMVHLSVDEGARQALDHREHETREIGRAHV